MHVFLFCQIVFVNKQLGYPLSWNNTLSEKVDYMVGSYILMIYRYLDAKEKYSLLREIITSNFM